MAQSTNVKVKNISGVTIKINKAVYINGVSDDDDSLPTIALASNDSESKMPAVGLTKIEIANNEIGTVTVVGNIGAIDTNAAKKNNTPVYVGVNGDILFKNPSDSSDSAIVQRIGTVTLVGDVENGQVYLFPLEMQVKHAATHKPDKSDPFLHADQHQKGGGDQIDHDKLKNTNLDGHPQYILASGRRSFTGAVSGKTPIKSSHLTTKGYVDEEGLQYSLTDGTRPFTGTVDGVTPTLSQHLATKGYVDGLIGQAYISVSLLTDSSAITTEYNPFDDSNHASYVQNTNWQYNVTSSGITYSPTAGTFTVDNSGIYEIVVTLALTQSSSGQTTVRLKKNSSQIFITTPFINSAVDPVERTQAIIVSAAANDIFEVTIDSSTTLTLVAEDGSTFNMKKI